MAGVSGAVLRAVQRVPKRVASARHMAGVSGAALMAALRAQDRALDTRLHAGPEVTFCRLENDFCLVIFMQGHMGPMRFTANR